MSGFPVDRCRIEKAANNALESVRKQRSKDYERAIAQKMSRWFFPCKTREEAILALEDSDPLISKWLIGGWGTEGDALNLLAACKVSNGETIYLSRGDAAFVANWEKNN
jgi:hypothetical protein